jgi:hypothetical protein
MRAGLDPFSFLLISVAGWFESEGGKYVIEACFAIIRASRITASQQSFADRAILPNMLRVLLSAEFWHSPFSIVSVTVI